MPPTVRMTDVIAHVALKSVRLLAFVASRNKDHIIIIIIEAYHYYILHQVLSSIVLVTHFSLSDRHTTFHQPCSREIERRE